LGTTPLSHLFCRKIHFVHHDTLKEGQSLIFFPIRNQQSAIGNVVISPSPLSSPRWVEEIFNYQLPFADCRFRATTQGRPYK
jgi:hypothetical protein